MQKLNTMATMLLLMGTVNSFIRNSGDHKELKQGF